MSFALSASEKSIIRQILFIAAAFLERFSNNKLCKTNINTNSSRSRKLHRSLHSNNVFNYSHVNFLRDFNLSCLHY